GLNSWYLKDGRFESSIKDTLSTVDSLPMVLGAANIDVESATKTFDFLTQNGFDDMYKCAEAEKCIQPAYIEFEKENCGLRFNYDASELKTDKDYSKVQPLKNNWFYYCKDIKRSL
ncbi:MAG: hypothetical protein ACXWC9_10990, partial [Pseudobdellovibrionaceae bacterium]